MTVYPTARRSCEQWDVWAAVFSPQVAAFHLSLPVFRCLSPTFHCLSPTFHCLYFEYWTALSLPLIDLSPTFHQPFTVSDFDLPLRFSLPFFDLRLILHCL